MVPSTVAALLTVFATGALAHSGCGGHEIGRRNLGGRTIQARAVTDEASAAESTDVATECTYYSYEPATSVTSQFPTIWESASLLSNDTEATELFSKINSTLNEKLPDDVPHGTSTGDWTGVNYDSSDPDCWWTHAKCDTPSSDTGLDADITVSPEPETWGLGFDDGPNCSHNALYNLLLENDQKATMFFIGSNVMDWPLQALRAYDEGHQICVHTWSHQYMTALSNEVAFAELYYTQKAIKAILGVTPQCWRPPFGDVDNRIRMIASMLNMTTIVWSDDTDDWAAGSDGITEEDVNNNYQTIIDAAGKGNYSTHGPIVLNHELTNYTMSVFETYYPKIKAAFKYVVPICTATNTSQPYAETNVTCPTFESYIAGTTNTSSSTVNTDGTTAANSSSSSESSDASSSASASGSDSSSSSSSSSAAFRDGVSGMGVVFAGLVAGAVLL
ncbi:hypothetical protein L202_02035 [Cryptococcus amylolentus CBS 6039]|uniref:chitin deacetylase n=2 Tax=Cryptococcus amylolentus TaxID=104669 RepID=A0A1E3HZ65_9TREE|nr:hypothetical protein L202_02035 [Cryptococcus amylolentus CBS 6039]ODN81630.1 hypothetical protein L202_02035 [Cryptococcus amylolentus CBS 6039]ODO10155.1 hypothetical protein I350_02383 [Cryptococcus amylolentus CBS 6273]